MRKYSIDIHGTAQKHIKYSFQFIPLSLTLRRQEDFAKRQMKYLGETTTTCVSRVTLERFDFLHI